MGENLVFRAVGECSFKILLLDLTLLSSSMFRSIIICLEHKIMCSSSMFELHVQALQYYMYLCCTKNT